MWLVCEFAGDFVHLDLLPLLILVVGCCSQSGLQYILEVVGMAVVVEAMNDQCGWWDSNAAGMFCPGWWEASSELLELHTSKHEETIQSCSWLVARRWCKDLGVSGGKSFPWDIQSWTCFWVTVRGWAVEFPANGCLQDIYRRWLSNGNAVKCQTQVVRLSTCYRGSLVHNLVVQLLFSIY